MPFLDKQFLEVSMNIDPSEKAFSKGAKQETDEDGCPKMEKVFGLPKRIISVISIARFPSTS